MKYFYDRQRHLVCHPFSVANLHAMAADLEIGSWWFDPNPEHPHYDIPWKRAAAVAARATLVRPREVLAIIKGGEPPAI